MPDLCDVIVVVDGDKPSIISYFFCISDNDPLEINIYLVTPYSHHLLVLKSISRKLKESNTSFRSFFVPLTFLSFSPSSFTSILC